MTEQEKKIKRYVNAIERELRLPLKAKARINGDIGTDIHARLEKGQSIDEIIAEMGTPQEVAAGFNEEMQDQLLPKGSPWRWVFLIAAILAGGAALLSILPFLLFYFQSSGMADGHFYNRRCKSSRPGAHTAVARRSLHSGMLRRLRAAALGAKRAACKAYACFDVFRRRFAVLAPVGHIVIVAGCLRGGRRCIVLENAAVPAVQPDAASEFLASRGNAVHCSAPPENRVPEAITSNEDMENPSPAGDGFLYFSALRRPQAYLRLS